MMTFFGVLWEVFTTVGMLTAVSWAASLQHDINRLRDKVDGPMWDRFTRLNEDVSAISGRLDLHRLDVRDTLTNHHETIRLLLNRTAPDVTTVVKHDPF